MKRILLTGGRGFIGRNILESPLARRYEILAPTHAELDLADTDAVDRWFAAHQVDAILHAAVKPGHRAAKDHSDLFLTNTRMFHNLARHADEVETMLVTGSGAIYDMRHYRPLVKEEDWRLHVPADEHGFTKYVCAGAIESSRNIVDLRIFGIFGPHEDYAIRFISNMICKALCDLPLTMKQDRVFSYLWIDDLMPVIDAFLSGPARYRSYNVTPDGTSSLRALADLVLEITGKDLPVTVAEPGLGLEYTGDNARLKNEFPQLKFTTISEAVRALAAWYAARLDAIDRTALTRDR